MNLKTDLLPHQRAAVEKLLPLRIGALFMEMGTGKSRTALELIQRRQEKISKVVWFCPVALKDTIRFEICKHTDTAPDQIHVFNQKTSERCIPAVFWYIVVGIESMSLSKRVIFTVNALIDEYTMAIVDESSYIKGHRAARTDWITRVSERARYRLILTGTPISQGVVDLFAQMRFLSPVILGYRSFYSFAANHLEYSVKYPGLIVRSHNTAFLAEKIKPYVYQVTKYDCLDLPDKLYHSEYFYMSENQRRAYEWAKEEILSAIDDDQQFNSYIIFHLFTVLQMIVCGFWHRTDPKTGEEHFHEYPHNRIVKLMDVISRIPENDKVILWAKYKYDIQQIKSALAMRYGVESTALFYGEIDEKKRTEQVNRFRSGARFFLATQSCGGHGLTINEAHHVIFYNNAFKFSERLQAEDRCHRIGQTHPVTYVDLICRDSIDTRIDDALAAKGNTVEKFKAEIEKIKDKDTLKERIKNL